MIEDILNNKFSDYLKALDIYEDSKSIKLSRIIVKDEFRGTGVGSEIMGDLINYADNNKKIITLTPSSDFGGNKNRLIQFYKRFGFKSNKGVHKSYEYRDTMIRWPKINEGSSTKTLIKNLLRESLINFS
jgi:predicted GNAT family N-acyltransferase